MTETNGTVADGKSDGGKKLLPTRGRRYFTAIKQEILGFAMDRGVASAAVKYGVTEATIYEWRNREVSSKSVGLECVTWRAC